MFRFRRRPKYVVGQHVYDNQGRCWVIDSISKNQFVLHLYGTTITHASVRSSIERYYSEVPDPGV